MTDHIKMSSLVSLVSTVLLICCITVSAYQDTANCTADVVVVTTDRLREEIRCELDDALAKVSIVAVNPQNLYTGTYGKTLLFSSVITDHSLGDPWQH